MSTIRLGRSRTLRWILSGTVFFLALLAGGTQVSQAAVSYTLYDTLAGIQNFGLTWIDTSKWAQIDPNLNTDLEMVRQIQGGKFVSTIRALGAASDYSNSLVFSTPSSVTSIRADVRLNQAFPPVNGSALMRILMSLYNDGTGSSTTGPAGDVRAYIGIRATQSGGTTAYNIAYRVFQCTPNVHDNCSTYKVVIPLTVLVSNATPGTAYTLGIAWDNSTNTLSLTVAGAASANASVNPTNGSECGTSCVLNKAAPYNYQNDLDSHVNTGLDPNANPTITGGEGYVAGDFASVYTNGSAYDDFSGSGGNSGPLLSASKWNSLDFVRGIQGGALNSIAAASDASGRVLNRLQLINTRAVTALKADVRVTAVTNPGSARIQARLGGAFYNNGTGSSGSSPDATGDIAAFVRIVSDSSGGALTAQLLVVACNNLNCSSTTTLSSPSLGGVTLGETHTLQVWWDGTMFSASMDGGTPVTYTPTSPNTPAIPAIQQWKEFRTDVDPQSNGGEPYIAATVANMYVNADAPAPPALAKSYQKQLKGNVVTAGIGLGSAPSPPASGTITLPSSGTGGIPSGATIDRAFLYWGIAANSATAYTSVTFAGNPVTGTLIGQTDAPNSGTQQAYAYRADVTSYVSPATLAYDVTVPGLPSAAGELVAGASLVVVYNNQGDVTEKTRVITIRDGGVLLGGNVTYYKKTMKNFVVSGPSPDARLAFLMAGGSGGPPPTGEFEGAGISNLLLNVDNSGCPGSPCGVFIPNPFPGSDGPYWNTTGYNTESPAPPYNPLLQAIGAGQNQGYPNASSNSYTIIWLASVFSVTGTSTSIDKVGLFRNGTWYLDTNGNGVWDGCGTDTCSAFGQTGDIQVLGDWNGSGTTKIGIFRPSTGTWYLDTNGNGVWDGCGTDTCSAFGQTGDVPVVGRW